MLFCEKLYKGVSISCDVILRYIVITSTAPSLPFQHKTLVLHGYGCCIQSLVWVVSHSNKFRFDFYEYFVYSHLSLSSPSQPQCPPPLHFQHKTLVLFVYGCCTQFLAWVESHSKKLKCSNLTFMNIFLLHDFLPSSTKQKPFSDG